MQLFIRKAHGLSLTEQGRHYFEQSQPLLEQLDRLTDQVANRSRRERLRLRCNIAYSAWLLPAKLAVLHAQFPNLEIDINNGIFEPHHASENAHVAIGYTTAAGLYNNATCKILTEDLLFPVVASHLTWPQITSQPLLTVTGYSGDWQWWFGQQTPDDAAPPYAHWLADCCRPTKQTIRSDNSLTVYQLCTQGLGVAMARSTFVEPFLARGQLKAIPHAPHLSAPDQFFARLTPQGEQHSAALALFDLL